MAAETKSEDIKEYYLSKLREAEENAATAQVLEERNKWRKIAMGYEMLAGLPGTPREAEAR
jgi:hypothetical protein